MIHHPQQVEDTFYLVMSHFFTGLNERMLVITSCPLKSPTAISVLLCLLSDCTASGDLRITAAGTVLLEILVVPLTLIACLWIVRFPC